MTWLVKALRSMFRPIVRLFTGRITGNAMVDILRTLVIEEARIELAGANPNGKVTKSRLALYTGFDTRTITAIEQRRQDTWESSDLCAEAAILSGWIGSFCDPETDEPMKLPIHGPGKTFHHLVTKSAGRNITPATALDRLERSGNVEISEDGLWVRLVNRYYVPINKDKQTFYEASAHGLDCLGRALNHNLVCHPDDRWLQQERWSRRIRDDDLPELRSRLRAKVQQDIRNTEEIIDRYDSGTQTDNTVTAGVGWYYWQLDKQFAP